MVIIIALIVAGCAPAPTTPSVPTLAPAAVAPAAAPTATETTLPTTAPTDEPETATPVAAAPEVEPSLVPETPAAAPVICEPTPPDMLGPFYVSGAPVRDRVGEGYVLSGIVRSAQGCAPIAGAMVELWMAGPDGEYTDAYRATQYTAEDGSYRFESHAPPPYSGRPPHIHLRVSAPRYATLVTQHYPAQGGTSATFDLIIIPQTNANLQTLTVNGGAAILTP